jgi:hypothetical protein
MNVLNQNNYADQFDVIVTGVSRNNDIFAITDNGEQVYINPDISRGMRVNIGTKLFVKVVPNFQSKRESGIKWRAYTVEQIASNDEAAPAPEPVWEPPTDEQVIEYIDSHGVVSTGDVTREYGFGDNFSQCRTQLDRLHREQKLVRADVYARQEQTKASYSLWATHEDDFYYTDSGVN